MTPNKLICPACNKEADTLVTHHWYELPNLIYHSKDICMSCNILLINKNFHLDTPDTINGLSSSQIGHILPDWGKQVKFIKDANEFYDSFNGELIYATCPKCSSTDIIKSGGRNIALKGGNY